MRIGSCFVFGFLFLTTHCFAEQTLDDWLKKNDPIVKEYLKGLAPRHVGERVKGVLLTDGTRELAGMRFVKNLSVPGRRAHIYRFQGLVEGKKCEVHYLWVDNGGRAMPPPSCAGEFFEPGGIAVLSGDVYTWREIQPTGALVRTTCQLRR